MYVKRVLSAVAGLAIGLGALVVTGQAAQAATNFQMPFPCGQVWEGQTRGPDHPRPHRPYEAIDFNRSNDIGDTVVASAAGTVKRVENTGSTSYGKWIEISHGSGWTTRYAHLSEQSVRVGQDVSQGQKIGEVGNTGGSDGAHLHFEQLQNGDPKRVKFDGVQALYYGTKSYKSKNKCGGSTPTNPYTAEEVCGTGYKQIDSQAVTGGRVHLMYNASNGYNCVVTLKSTKLGTESEVSAFLEVRGEARKTDKGDFGYYAGPVRKSAPGKCVKWGGQVGASGGYTSPFEHCG